METATGVLVLLVVLAISLIAVQYSSSRSGYSPGAAAEMVALDMAGGGRDGFDTGAAAEMVALDMAGGGRDGFDTGAAAEMVALDQAGGGRDGLSLGGWRTRGRRSGFANSAANAELSAIDATMGAEDSVTLGCGGSPLSPVGANSSCRTPYPTVPNPKCKVGAGCGYPAYVYTPHENPIIASGGAAITIFP